MRYDPESRVSLLNDVRTPPPCRARPPFLCYADGGRQWQPDGPAVDDESVGTDNGDPTDLNALTLPKSEGDKHGEVRRSRMRSRRIPILVGGIIWSAFVSLFLAVMVIPMVRQVFTYGYASTDGEIDSIVVETQTSSDSSPTHRVKATYHFTVNDRRFDSTNVRFGQVATQDQSAARFVATHPPGPTIVYYSASDPSRSVLIRGLQGIDIFALIFMTPFVCIGVGRIAYGSGPRRSTGAFPGLSVTENPEQVLIRPTAAGTLWPVIVGLGASAFLTVFIVGFGVGTDRSLPFMLAVAGCVLAVPVVVYIALRQKALRGDSDIAIDFVSKKLRIGNGEPISFAAIRQIKLHPTSHWEGGEAASCSIHAVGERIDVRFPNRWCSTEDAQKLAAYVALQIGVDGVDEQGKVFTAPDVKGTSLPAQG